MLDASVPIAHLDASDARHDRATTLLMEHADEPFAASPVTLAEVLLGPARAGRLDQADAALRRLDVAAVPLAHDAAARLATVRAVTRLKLPDCCVLLAAEQTRSAVVTFDDRLAAAARERGLDVSGL
ncbi:MAG: type II toxin-antitoxin system VapC family toxin [Mycobacteriales bacterium]